MPSLVVHTQGSDRLDKITLRRGIQAISCPTHFLSNLTGYQALGRRTGNGSSDGMEEEVRGMIN